MPPATRKGEMMQLTIEQAMRHAIAISEKGAGRTSPNPIVGAVILDSNMNLISEGFHAGQAHAEIVAINIAKQIPEDATLVVTLEPCNHFGKSGPCSQAILRTNIKKVVYAHPDPNPLASGGAQYLIDNGIEVIGGLLKDEAAWSNRHWLIKIKLGRPRFTWKVAITLDGKVAAKDNSSKWITNIESRTKVAILRNTCDAMLVGTGTVLHDNPSLTVRDELLPAGVAKQNPERIILGMRDIPANYNVFNNESKSTIIKSNSVKELIEYVKRREFNNVLVEAGPTLGTALLKAELIDELQIFIAPKLFGDSGFSFVEDLNINNIGDAREFKLVSHEVFGNDIALTLINDKVSEVA